MTMNIHMHPRISGLARLCAGLLLALAVGCSSSKPDRGATFLDSKPEESVLDESEEAERLRKLQLIRVWEEEYDPNGTLISEGWKDRDAYRLSFDVMFYCQAKFGWLNNSGVCAANGVCSDNESCDCEELACSSLISLCMGHTFAELAAPRSGPYRLDWYQVPGQNVEERRYIVDVPPQPLAANAAMFRYGMSGAQSAMYRAGQAFLDTTEICSENPVFGPKLTDERQIEPGSPPGAPRQRLDVVFSNTFLEAYRLYQDLAERTVDAVVSVADWQRSHPSLQVQLDRAVLGDQLSRAEAAHLLVGGAPGLQQSRELSGGPMGLCSSPELSGPAQRALQAIRDTAPDPQLFRDPGSLEWDVTRRLSALGLLSANADTAEMRSVLDLRGEDFIEAARYVEQEFITYSRSLDPSIRITAGRPSNLVWHASTANPPPLREDVFYATIARESPTTISQASALSAVGLRELRDASDLSSVTDAALSVAVAIMAKDFAQGSQSNDVDDIVDPALAPLVADGREQRLGRWLVCSYAGDTWRSILGGFSPSDALIVVQGEEGLECAVQGKIEGIPCTLDSWIVRTMSQNLPWTVDPVFETWVDDYNSNSDYSFEFSGERRFYLVKPRDPLAPPAAGQYTPLAGVQIPDPTSTGACVRIPIVPAAEKVVADILKPSRKWCTQSKVSCAKEDYDARLPLEDELSEDNSGVENSWRTYLDMAKQAAAEADLLGEQVVNFGLEYSRREEDIQLREQAQEVAVLQELENLQTICGTSVDIESLNLNPWNTAGQDCPCTDGLVCFGEKCIPDLVAQIDALARNDTQYQRLAKCISESQEIEYVTTGDKPLKAWRREGYANSLCQGRDGAPPQSPCPVLETEPLVVPDDPNDPNDDNLFEVVPINETLNYFRSDNASPPRVERRTCDDLRLLRETVNRPWASSDGRTREDVRADILKTNFFHPALLVQLAAALGWEARLGGFGAVRYNGLPVFETGEFGASPATGWPCGPLAPPAIVCPSGSPNSLFCANLSCAEVGTDPGLAYTNERLRNAIIALRLSLGMNLKGISFPLFMDPNYQATHSIPEPRAYTRPGPGGIPIQNYVYTDFKSSNILDLSLPFGTIVRHDVDIARRVGWCWGPDDRCPGELAEFVPWTQAPDSVPNFDIAFSEIGDFMLDSYREQRRVERSELDALFSEIPVVGGAVGNRLGTLECKVRDCEVTEYFIGDWPIISGPFDGNFWIWADMTQDSLFMRSGNALKWFQNAPTASLGWTPAIKADRAGRISGDLTSAIFVYLSTGDEKDVRFWPDDFKVAAGTHKLDVLAGFQGLEIAERGLILATSPDGRKLTPLGVKEIVDGMELLCEVAAQVQAEPSCQWGTAPEIRSPADLNKASNHLACMAGEFQGSCRVS